MMNLHQIVHSDKAGVKKITQKKRVLKASVCNFYQNFIFDISIMNRSIGKLHHNKLSFISYTQITDIHDNISKWGKILFWADGFSISVLSLNTVRNCVFEPNMVHIMLVTVVSHAIPDLPQYVSLIIPQYGSMTWYSVTSLSHYPTMSPWLSHSMAPWLSQIMTPLLSHSVNEASPYLT